MLKNDNECLACNAIPKLKLGYEKELRYGVGINKQQGVVMYFDDECEFKVLLDKTITKFTVNKRKDEIQIECSDGTKYLMYHDQSCCEGVSIESMVGDVESIIGNPILLAEEVTGDTPNDYKFECEPESYTWTFYKLATIKGYLDIRWLGTSNGYYSEAVNFKVIKP